MIHENTGYRCLHTDDPSRIVFEYDADEPTSKPIYPRHYNRVPGKADIHAQKVQGVHVCLNLESLTALMITASMCKGAKAYIGRRTGASETF